MTTPDTRPRGGLVAALAWLAFPAVPVVLENVFRTFSEADPRAWAWLDWVVQLGPLVGFAYLAGPTLDLPDEPTPRRGPRAWLSRRAVWVAVGPWSGMLAWFAFLFVVGSMPP